MSTIVLILALTMQGEAGIMSDAAALGVGHILQNRARLIGYEQAVAGFYGYDPGMEVQPRYLELAQQVLESEDTTTGGCLYVFSYQDVGALFKDAPCMRALADWQSEMLRVRGTPYRLYGYREWPDELNVYAAPMCDKKW